MNAPNQLVIDGDVWVVTNGKDKITVTIHEVLSDVSHDLGTDPGLQKDGVEAHLQVLLAANPTVIADGLRLVRREYPTDIGRVDLLCRESRAARSRSSQTARRIDGASNSPAPRLPQRDT